jgi:hypothetical protein
MNGYELNSITLVSGEAKSLIILHIGQQAAHRFRATVAGAMASHLAIRSHRPDIASGSPPPDRKPERGPSDENP